MMTSFLLMNFALIEIHIKTTEDLLKEKNYSLKKDLSAKDIL